MPSRKPRRGHEPPDLFRTSQREKLRAAGWIEQPTLGQWDTSNWLAPNGHSIFTEAEAVEQMEATHE
jgi:hypothetical protein